MGCCGFFVVVYWIEMHFAWRFRWVIKRPITDDCNSPRRRGSVACLEVISYFQLPEHSLLSHILTYFRRAETQEEHSFLSQILTYFRRGGRPEDVAWWLIGAIFGVSAAWFQPLHSLAAWFQPLHSFASWFLLLHSLAAWFQPLHSIAFTHSSQANESE